jgi:2-oxoglutarate ferredoxin oxidoreductase subunit alpha
MFMNGNDALAEGAIRGGCDCYFGYPITPQNELTAYMSREMPAKDRVFIQAESEIAAINMVYGAAATGKRAMTSSSSPGISLKQEGLSYIAGARLPMLVVNVQRGGPGLGAIDPSQSDYFQSVKGGGHGDYRLIVLAPDSVQEMHDFAVESFALSEKYRVPVMILSDGRIGQMMEPVTLWENGIPESGVKEWALTGAKGRERNIIRSFFNSTGALEEHNKILQETYQQISKNEVRCEEFMMDDADVMMIAFGTSARLCREVVRIFRENGKRIGLLRPITLWPFPTEIIAEYAQKVNAALVVEMNAGQMIEDVRLSCNGKIPIEFCGRMGGGVPSVEEICSALSGLF